MLLPALTMRTFSLINNYYVTQKSVRYYKKTYKSRTEGIDANISRLITGKLLRSRYLEVVKYTFNNK